MTILGGQNIYFLEISMYYTNFEFNRKIPIWSLAGLVLTVLLFLEQLQYFLDFSKSEKKR